MSAKQLTVDDYQSLCDTGWRRSGTYLYRPDNSNDSTCCPQYTIRLDVCRFKPAKDQKQTSKRLNNYLVHDNIHGDTSKQQQKQHVAPPPSSTEQSMNDDEAMLKRLAIDDMFTRCLTALSNNTLQQEEIGEIVKCLPPVRENAHRLQKDRGTYSCSMSPLNKHKKMLQNRCNITVQQLIDAVINEINNDINKLLPESTHLSHVHYKDNHINFIPVEDSVNHNNPQTRPVAPSSEPRHKKLDVPAMPLPVSPKHKLETTLRRAEYSEEVFQLYCRYQTEVHHETEAKKPEGFKRFLVDTPLIYVPYSEKGYYSPALNKVVQIPETGFGSFHQLYRLDGKLIAVGIVDILPSCVSSVYFLYDPDYLFLSIGKYSALAEIEWTKQLALQAPQLHYYYMGFFIRDCQKMKYKAMFRPSELLCHETQQWVDLDVALAKIDSSANKRYSPFVVEAGSGEYVVPSKRYPNVINQIKMMQSGRPFTLLDIQPKFREEIKSILVDYMDNVGERLAKIIQVTFSR
ncbi:hypothetical protein SAMD00019534_119520 [Acytostelium subglobosum LB1]|uniref:hypothetical protein n=1 Tax=Acytostelium subglobosum LB1 TaxID=1410327 RepID=UPI000644ADD1|nr:hypothetical protein SAMD00019534_119520 [Acytostelium subglobosum LB1]GAM28776.1 hypothetical protein SAMD00019534_119520 [Acytostelium subglobosum LB1]|eukprot:XP_012748331.1 hypothetical protein SAMD00019534_119520 [Acytostelium subglobosum LB1]